MSEKLKFGHVEVINFFFKMLLVFFQVECFHPLGAQKMYQTELKRDLRLYHKQCMFPVRTSPCSFEKKNAVLSAIRKKTG